MLEKEQAYRMALAAAKSEFDEVKPAFDKLQQRVNSLRTTMKGLSELINEELDDEYRFNIFRSDYTPFSPRQKRVGHGSPRQNKQG